MDCKFTKQDKEWLSKCLSEGDKYKIAVDNDSVEVWDFDNSESFYTFSCFGEEFIVNSLIYFGVSADFV